MMTTDSGNERDGGPHDGRGKQDAGPRRGRVWLIRLVMLIVVPVLLLAVTELGLRVFGYGYSTDFFVKLPGKGVYAANGEFSLRFFPPSLRRNPWPIYMATDKPADTYRIFVLGGSAAQGVPDPAYGFAGILETMLTETFPGAKFEIVVTAMTAINSHVVLPIARDCAEHEPDLFIVLLGNNEVVGPFGAGTVFGGFTPSLSVIRAHLAVKTTRLGQLVAAITAALGPRGDDEQWRGLEMFMDNRIPADDPRLAFVYANLGRNLADIVRAADDADAATLLCTVPVNLGDCPPFASLHREGLNEADLNAWTVALATGIGRAASGDNAGAIESFLAAMSIDDRFAELHYRLAQCYQEQGRKAEALEAFSRARDLDALRFRADSSINQVIRDVAAEQAMAGVRLVDAEGAMADCDRALEGVPGRALFYEHVHMTFEGNYEVARAVFGELVQFLPSSIVSRAAGPTAPPSLGRCMERMELTRWQRAQMLAYMLEMTKHPPFTEQFDHAERYAAMEAFRRWLESKDQPPGDEGAP